jgi:ureidoacrylate peracid hydrolase
MTEVENRRLRIHDLQSSKTALLVIDVQNDFCHEEGVFSKKKKIDVTAVTQLISFVDRCRQFDLAIIFIQTIHSSWTDSPAWIKRLGGAAEKMDICRPDSWGSQFYRLMPKESDCIVTKHRFSAFTGTDLDLILRSKGIETLLFTGVTTNVCVETTARDGVNRNYNVILLEDCCAAFDLGEHQAALNNINKYFGVVTSSSGFLETLEKQDR